MLDFYNNNWHEIPINIGLYNENLARQQKQNKKALDKMENDVKELIKQGVTIDIAKALSNRLYKATVKKIEIVRKCKAFEANKGIKFNL